ncbi:MAG: ATP-dependent helicase [Myxococcales bacterium]|nr:ATP-dependent helicase [Myxococcales bacterium]
MAALTDDQRRWLERQAALAAAARRVWPDAAAPYAGTMRIRSGGRARDVLVGDGGHVGAVVRIDHASAPLAEVFYGCRPGDAYEVEAGARVLTGELVERARVRFAGGALVEVAGDGVRLRRVGDAWVAEPDPPLVTVSGPRRAGGLVGFAQLDAAQRAAVEAPGGAALILGEAGAGKTTVALHRLAWRRRALEAAGRRCRALVVVPNAALGRMVEGQLAALGLPEVPVVTFDDWAWRQAARAFVDWPRRRSGDATAATVALKRHPALLAEVEALARALPPAAEGRCGRRAQLIHLFGDRDRVARVAAAGLPAGAVAETLEHCHVQFSDPAEVEWSHVDAARLRTIDARLIDEGTPMADAGSADVEDAAVMFALDRALAAASGRAAARPRRYDVLVVDEAQALTAVELALLGRAVAAGGDLVVAGDAGQHFDEGVAFAGWPAALAALGAPGARVTTLRTSYRCPPALARWARRWVEPSVGSAAVGSTAVGSAAAGAVASEASEASAPVASVPVASAPVTSAMASTGTTTRVRWHQPWWHHRARSPPPPGRRRG